MATRRENSENHLRLVREENETIQVRKVMLIFNPLRIRGQRYYRRNKERVITMFAESEIEVEEKPTERAGHAEDILRDTVLTGIDAVCILGGDGSLKEAVSGLITREDQCTIPIAIIPSGTGNNFAKDLNLFGVERAVQCVIGGRIHPIENIRVEHSTGITYSINIIGWGLCAHANITAENNRWLGPLRYDLGGLRHIIRGQRFNALVKVENEQRESAQYLTAFINLTRCIGRGFQVAPRAMLDDGMMDVILCHANVSRCGMLRIFNQAKAWDETIADAPGVEYIHAKSIEITPEHPMQIVIDGEIGFMTPCKIEVIPSAIKMFM